MEKEIYIKETPQEQLYKTLKKYEEELNQIHGCIGIQLVDDEAEILVERLNTIKSNIIDLKMQSDFDQRYNKKCKKLTDTAQNLLAYYSVFVNKDKFVDLSEQNEESVDELENYSL